ncbi:MAG: phosphoadenylyl-sulfate reductase [Bryobacteraceae bacterium]
MEDKIDGARRVIAAALEGPGEPCVTSSFQAECVVLVHMAAAARPLIPVLFLDTGYHFAETYTYRDQIVERLGLNLVNILPRLTVPEQEREFGVLYRSAPDRCCAMRKVEPLFAALEPYDVWFTGLRRDQSPTRKDLQVAADFQLPGGKILRKVSPLADWTAADVWAYLKRYGIPPLPLYDQGYSSIGCEPCTSLPLDPDNPRSGRWAGQKLECGIHIQAK